MVFAVVVWLCLAGRNAHATQAGEQAAPPAQPQKIRTVLIVIDKPGDPFVERIRAEIATLGLNVVMRGRVGPLEEDARNLHAIAAVRVLASRIGVEVWMADETSGRSLLRQIIVDERRGGPDQSLIALQTAELLRTSLFPKPPPAPDPEPALIATKAPAQATGDRGTETGKRAAETGIQAGLGTLYSSGGAGPSLQAWLSLHQSFGRHLGVALDFSAPVYRGSMNGIEGSGAIGSYLSGLALLFRLKPDRSHWRINLGLAAAVAWVTTRGNAVAPLVGNSSSVVTGAGYGRVDIGWSRVSWLKLGFTGLAGATTDKVTVRFAGNDAGTWGWPFVAGFLSAQLNWR